MQAGLHALSPADTTTRRQEGSPRHSAPVGAGILFYSAIPGRKVFSMIMYATTGQITFYVKL